MSRLGLSKKRSWVRRDREDESYCRTCKTWKPKKSSIAGMLSKVF
jgi:hypothetical protein